MIEQVAQPSFLIYVFTGLFGLALGSFLNVVIYRLPLEDMSILRPKFSACPHCHYQIPWHDNIPLLSYFFLLGKCRSCKQRISLRYPFVELSTAALLLFTLWMSPGESWGIVLLKMLLMVSMLAITFIDFDHFIIPDIFTIPGMLLAPLAALLWPQLHADSFLLQKGLLPTKETALLLALFGMIVGAGVVYLVGVIGKLFFRKDAMGLGDVKFMGAMGGFLGAEAVIAAFFVGAFLGAIFGLANVIILGLRSSRRLLKRGWQAKRAIVSGLVLGRRQGAYIPFGPFLAAGCAVLLFFRHEVFTFALETWPQWFRNFLS